MKSKGHGNLTSIIIHLEDTQTKSILTEIL